MQDDTLLEDDSNGIATRLLVVALAVLLVAVVVVLATAVSGGILPGTGSDGGTIDETELASLQTFEPRCGTHRSSNSSTFSRPVDGGEQLSINETIPVAARDSELRASLDEIGEHRYQLDFERTPGDRSTDCYLELRYNVTVNLTSPDEYTIVVTHDDELQGVVWADPGQSGRWGTSADTRPPSMNDSEWRAALDASDRYFENRTGSDVAGDGGATGGGGGGGSGG